MFSASPNTPVPVAPSPKKQTVTSSRPCDLHAVPAPAAIGMPAPTIPLVPSSPISGIATCMQPPLPRE